MACYSNEDVAAGRLRDWQVRVLGRAESIADKHLVSMCKAWVPCLALGRRNRGKKKEVSSIGYWDLSTEITETLDSLP